MTPAQRVLRARVGGYAARAKHDGRELTTLARAAYRDSFRRGHSCVLCPAYRMPTGLSDAEVTRRADSLRKAHYARLSLKSAKTRANPR
jgi:hypothetical protein